MVKDGHRTRLGSSKSTDLSNAWHQLELEVKGDALAVSLDGKRVVEAHDKTFAEPGRIGVWTHVSSLATFDDFAITPL